MKARQVMPQAQSHEAVPHKLSGGEAMALLWGEFPGPAHQLDGHQDRLRMAVGGLPGEHMPDDQATCGQSRQSQRLAACACANANGTACVPAVFEYNVDWEPRPCFPLEE